MYLPFFHVFITILFFAIPSRRRIAPTTPVCAIYRFELGIRCALLRFLRIDAGSPTQSGPDRTFTALIPINRRGRCTRIRVFRRRFPVRTIRLALVAGGIGAVGGIGARTGCTIRVDLQGVCAERRTLRHKVANFAVILVSLSAFLSLVWSRGTVL